jgi:hypothetical protein
MAKTNTNVNNNTEDLDKKKQTSDSRTNTTDENIKNIWQFLISLIVTILSVIGYFILSSIVLYECKLAQSNIVPTNLECYPYTENYPEIQKISTNIFISNTEPQSSVKLNFPYDKYNSKSAFLEMFRKYKESPKAGSFIIYIVSILEGLFNYSNNALTIFFNFLNGMPEILVIILGPFISIIYFVIASLVGIVVFIFSYFYEMKWFFKENTNKNPSGKPVWSDINIIEPIRYCTALFLCFVFFILFWILLFTVIPILAPMIFFICFFMTLGYKGDIDNKKTTIFTIIQETFKHYKVTMTTILSIMIIRKTFNNLGLLSGIFSIIIVLLIYFKFIPMNIFEPIKATNLTALSSFEQAVKKCNPIKNTSNGLFGLSNKFFDNIKGGGDIGRELKKIHKQLNN